MAPGRCPRSWTWQPVSPQISARACSCSATAVITFQRHCGSGILWCRAVGLPARQPDVGVKLSGYDAADPG